MRYRRMAIEVESPEEVGYGTIRCNLAESSMRDQVLGELRLDVDLARTILLYGDHRGQPALRELLAAEGGCTASQVLLTPGAAGALFIVSTSLLSAGDHLVVLRPNYATNIETPRAIGCDISFVELKMERGFQYGADDIAAKMTPKTRLVSITTPHNPTGTVLSDAELGRIVELVTSRGAYLLVDETYRDLSVDTPRRFATTLSERVISVASPSSVSSSSRGAPRGSALPSTVGRSSIDRSSTAVRHSSGNAFVPFSGVSRPHATGVSGEPPSASRAFAFATPGSQCASPVPAIVTASIATSSRWSR